MLSGNDAQVSLAMRDFVGAPRGAEAPIVNDRTAPRMRDWHAALVNCDFGEDLRAHEVQMERNRDQAPVRDMHAIYAVREERLVRQSRRALYRARARPRSSV